MKMTSFRNWLVTAIGIGIMANKIKAEANWCGVNAPDPMKTCVSVRLPWQPDPIYFCMEKEKFKYKNRCMSNNMHCGMDMMRNDTLMINTPWDCCPTISVPNHCMNMNCPPPPMNRVCKTLDYNNANNRMDYANSWDCCSTYWCEDNTMPDNCRMKRMEPMCTNPPAGKMNCVGFHDPYGCCTKYQCDGEGKPGMCPMQHQSMQMMMRYNTTHNQMMNMSMGMMGGGMMGGGMMGGGGGNMMSANLVKPPDAPAAMGEGAQDAAVMSIRDAEMLRQKLRARRAGMMNSMPMNYNNMQCIGDPNCPGNMKCCSNDMSVYGDGRFMMKNMNPTHGYCVDPVMMAAIPQG